MTVRETLLPQETRDKVGVSVGLLPAAPLPMPKQVLELQAGPLARLLGSLGMAARVARIRN